MKTYLKLFCLLIVTFSLLSCATSHIKKEWTYEEEAVYLEFKVDSQLNLYNGVPHTLYAVIYQLKDPNAFNQLIEDEDGLYKLLEGKVFDGSVASSKTLIMNPGQDVSYKFDRAEGAKYVAIVAGYSTMHKDIMIRLIDIPVKGGIKPFMTKKTTPKKLEINLKLGPQQIKDIEGKK